MTHDPFRSVKNLARGDSFVGRSAEQQELKECLESYGIVHVVGLPRMGKTSLIDHTFMEDDSWQHWADNKHVLPVRRDLSATDDDHALWEALSVEMGTALWQLEPTEAEELGNSCIAIADTPEADAPEADALYRQILIHALKVKEKLGKKFLFIFDEMDFLSDKNHHYSRNLLGRIIGLSAFGWLVTCSRRLPWQICKRKFGTNWFGSDEAVVYVRPFSKEDVTLYWKRFSEPFSGLSNKQFKKYQGLVQEYTGSHPMLMSLMNHYAIDENILQAWSQAATTAEKKRLEEIIRLELVKDFDEQMRYVEEQELKEAAIRLVLEGIKRPDEEDTRLLINYGFILEVEAKVKRRIFGYDLGPSASTQDKRYICFSDFACHQLRENYEPLIDGIDLLEITEKKLRELVKELLKKEYGEYCLIPSMPEADENYQEPWEELFRRKPESEDEKERWEERKASRRKRIDKSCKPPSERAPIDTISSFALGDLWYTFFKNEGVWTKEAKEVEKFRKNWKKVFPKMNLLRNATQHFYDEEKTDAFIRKAEAACNQMCKDIDEWLKENASVAKK